MKPALFDYVCPTTLDDALETLRQRGDDAKCLAGGQSLVPLLNLRLSKPHTLIDLNRITELAYIRAHNGGLALGALARQRAIETSALVRDRASLLHEVTPLIGHPPIRSRGTLGGSLAHADPAAEYPAVVLALDGHMTLKSAGGERVVPAREFFVSYLTTACKPTEVLTRITLPSLPPRTGTAFMELTQRHGDFAVVGVAAAVTLDDAGAVSRARIVLCGVGPTPLRAAQAETALEGQAPTGARLVEAGRLAIDATDPADDLHGSAEYRREMTAVLTRRTLARALERLGVRL
ncbi:MAG: FAD binding domain-containing protein [Candidatus Rokuibacteriota bacterium]